MPSSPTNDCIMFITPAAAAAVAAVAAAHSDGDVLIFEISNMNLHFFLAFTKIHFFLVSAVGMQQLRHLFYF